ncbi:MAG: hypothetical protein JNL83_17540 [Myxococcales bacterium]|nr:hypothetical protein [Myxococcales bacterium]
MRIPTLLVFQLSLAAGASGCSSKKQTETLGSAGELRVRAAKLGCDLKGSGEVKQNRSFPGHDVTMAGCRVWVGPCNCVIDMHYLATAKTDELLEVNIGTFDCRAGAALERVFQLSDFLFRDDADRSAFHDLLASPPKVTGADPNAAITARRPMRSVVIKGTWSPVVWKDFSPTSAEQAFAEHTMILTIAARTDREYSATTEVGLNFSAGLPVRPCEDGSRRPWERTPQ